MYLYSISIKHIDFAPKLTRFLIQTVHVSCISFEKKNICIYQKELIKRKVEEKRLAGTNKLLPRAAQLKSKVN
jgi:hypothetical protein